MASDQLLTDKDRARVKKLREILARGESPYTQLGDKGAKDQGGLDKDRKVKPSEVIERSEARTKQLEARWQAGVEGTLKPEKVYLEVPIDGLEPFEAVKYDPSKAVCSFCKVEVERLRATEGQGRLKRIAKTYIAVVNGVREVREDVKYVSEKVTACPNCILQIRDIRLPRGD
jgi:hypothetical protein